MYTVLCLWFVFKVLFPSCLLLFGMKKDLFTSMAKLFVIFIISWATSWLCIQTTGTKKKCSGAHGLVFKTWNITLLKKYMHPIIYHVRHAV